MNLELIVRHQFRREVTSVCAVGNDLFVAATYLIFYLKADILESPVKICTYQCQTRINDMIYEAGFLHVASEGDGILNFFIDNEILKVKSASKIHNRIKRLQKYENYIISIDLEGNLNTFNLENNQNENNYIVSGGRCLVLGSIFNHSIKDLKTGIITACCLNGEVVEIGINKDEDILGIWNNVCEKLKTEKITDIDNTKVINLNMIGYYHKLSDNSKAFLKGKYQNIENKIKLYQ